MWVRLSCDTKRVTVAPCDRRRQPIMKAQSNICSIRTHSLFIHANTTILKKLNRVSSPSLTGGIRQSIYQDLGYVSPRPSLCSDTIANWQTKVDNGPWFVCTGLPLSFLYGWFANNAWFGTWVSRQDFPCMCMLPQAHTHKHTHAHVRAEAYICACTLAYSQSPNGIPPWFFCLLSTTSSKNECLY